MQKYLRSVDDGQGLRFGDFRPRAGSVAMGAAARGALDRFETGEWQDGVWGELVRCGLVAVGCVLGVVVFEREFFLRFVPWGLVERVPVLERFRGRGDTVAAKKCG